MIITRQELTTKGVQEFQEEIKFAPSLYEKNNLIISIDSLKGYVRSEYLSNLTILKIKLQGKLTLKSTRSLKPVPYKLRESDEIVLCHDKDLFDPDSMIMFEGDSLNVDELFYSMMVSSLPLKVISKDDQECIDYGDYEVITEDEYYKQKQNKNPLFSALENFDFSDNDEK